MCSGDAQPQPPNPTGVNKSGRHQECVGRPAPHNALTSNPSCPLPRAEIHASRLASGPTMAANMELKSTNKVRRCPSLRPSPSRRSRRRVSRFYTSTGSFFGTAILVHLPLLGRGRASDAFYPARRDAPPLRGSHRHARTLLLVWAWASRFHTAWHCVSLPPPPLLVDSQIVERAFLPMSMPCSHDGPACFLARRPTSRRAHRHARIAVRALAWTFRDHTRWICIAFPPASFPIVRCLLARRPTCVGRHGRRLTPPTERRVGALLRDVLAGRRVSSPRSAVLSRGTRLTVKTRSLCRCSAARCASTRTPAAPRGAP
jgi:hypothetical protein